MIRAMYKPYFSLEKHEHIGKINILYIHYISYIFTIYAIFTIIRYIMLIDFLITIDVL